MNSVLEIRDEELIRRALMTIKPTHYRPLWIRVSHRFSLGSTHSQQLCERFGLNGDAQSRDTMQLAAAPQSDEVEGK